MLSQSLRDKWIRISAGSLLILSPIPTAMAYLKLADLGPPADIPVAATVIAVGVGGICLLPITGYWRALLSAAYAVCAVELLFISAIMIRGGL